MTALEITHSITEQEIKRLVEKLRPNIPAVSFFPQLDHLIMRLSVEFSSCLHIVSGHVIPEPRLELKQFETALRRAVNSTIIPVA